MKRVSKITAFTGSFLVLAHCGIQAQTLSATADTYITEHPFLGTTSSVHGSDTFMEAIYPAGFRSTPLVRFDLSSVGMSTFQDATFQLFLSFGFNDNAAQVIEVHRSLSAWDETTSWDTIPGGGPYGSYDPAALDTQTVTFNPSSGQNPRYVSWTIPSSVIASWISDPTSNYGLVLISFPAAGTAGPQDLGFASRESGVATAPLLTLSPLQSTVPEPGSLALLVSAGLSGATLLRRRRSLKRL